ncbi:MAG: hypothetical protein KDJ99_13050 [Candidatus Competibacteraceae bacterium]|jgi:hypothetical protein|nr:hypothetical protein [Candidatus Competibacteraceae bacterium]
MATERTLRLRLSAYERGLIWDYGYPFEDLRRQLQALAENDDEHVVTIDPYYLDHLLADLVRSMKRANSRLLDELDELYDNIASQAAEQGHHVL